MQTFLPYPSFKDSAKCLDSKRLGKQRVEVKQIYIALTQRRGWIHHPATKMWAGYKSSLLEYGLEIVEEWISRGFKDSLKAYFLSQPLSHESSGAIISPEWLGNPQFHASHRSNLMRKDPGHYGRFGWSEPDNIPYFWPTKEGF